MYFMKKVFYTLTLLSLCTLAGKASQVESYSIDPTHSSIKFSIRHFVAKTTGSFGQFEGTMQIDRSNLSRSFVKATIQIPSIDTNNDKRDAHLQRDDYFGAASHPIMTFESTQWNVTERENHFEVIGDLSFNGVTQSVSLSVELLGFGKGMRGAYLSGWEATTTLDRTNWGVDGGQAAVGNEVEVTINIEAIRD